MSKVILILISVNSKIIASLGFKVFLFIFLIVLIYIFFSIRNNPPDLETFLKEKRARNMKEAYLRAVRARNYDRVVSPEDLKYIMMSEQEFDIQMFNENCDEVIYFELFKEDNYVRIRQAQMSKEWVNNQRSDGMGEWEMKDMPAPPLPSFQEAYIARSKGESIFKKPIVS